MSRILGATTANDQDTATAVQQVLNQKTSADAARPSFTRAGEFNAIGKYYHYAQQLADHLETTGGEKDEHAATLQNQMSKIADAYIAGITLTTSVGDVRKQFLDKHYPIDPVQQTDPEARKKGIQQQTQRLKADGKLLTLIGVATSNNTAAYMQTKQLLAAIDANQTEHNQDTQYFAVINAEEQEREDNEHDNIKHDEDLEAFDEALVEAEATAENKERDYEITKENLFDAIGIDDGAEQPGIDLAAERQAAGITQIKTDALAELKGEYLSGCSTIRASGMNESEMQTALAQEKAKLKDGIEVIAEKAQDELHQVAKAREVFSSGSQQSEYRQLYSDDEWSQISKNGNSALQPKSASPIINISAK
ncbi:MAG: hypothetical protein P1U34_08895 [Coxiellaceae bacterium]|nr:hypothetical protein [Coxiellaceae bacterium]